MGYIYVECTLVVFVINVFFLLQKHRVYKYLKHNCDVIYVYINKQKNINITTKLTYKPQII